MELPLEEADGAAQAAPQLALLQRHAQVSIPIAMKMRNASNTIM